LKPIINSTAAAWVMAVGWSLFTVVMMLSPGSDTAASDLSAVAGGTEWTDYLGHAAITLTETLLLVNLLMRYMPLRAALIWSAVPVLAVTAVLEFLQRWVPDRGSSVFDAAANAVGIAIGVWLARRLETRRAERPLAK
jgi:VanZ family protein